MRVLVTGGAGFIGSHTVDLLLSAGDEVFVVDNFSTGRVDNLAQAMAVHKRFRPFECDINEYKRLDKAFLHFKPEAVIHLAAQSAITVSNKKPQVDAMVNIIGTINVVDLCKKYDVERLVFSSTSAVYKGTRSPWFGMKENFPKEPQSPYGISKLAAEQYIRTMFPNHVIFRYGNVYGPRQVSVGENQVIARAFSYFMRESDHFEIVGSGEQKRDFIFVENVAEANLIASYPNGGTGTFNLATGQSRSVNEVVRIVKRNCVSRFRLIDHTKNEDPRGSVYINNSLFKKKLKGFRFVGLEEGIEKTHKWWFLK